MLQPSPSGSHCKWHSNHPLVMVFFSSRAVRQQSEEGWCVYIWLVGQYTHPVLKNMTSSIGMIRSSATQYFWENAKLMATKPPTSFCLPHGFQWWTVLNSRAYLIHCHLSFRKIEMNFGKSQTKTAKHSAGMCGILSIMSFW